MPRTVQGIVSRSVGEPVTLEEIVIPDPGPGEAVVNIQACGVCHTDLHYREGGINNDFPFFLGHEAAGLVAEVAPTTDQHIGTAGEVGPQVAVKGRDPNVLLHIGCPGWIGERL